MINAFPSSVEVVKSILAEGVAETGMVQYNG
jgi:hypothetical protein